MSIKQALDALEDNGGMTPDDLAEINRRIQSSVDSGGDPHDVIPAHLFRLQRDSRFEATGELLDKKQPGDPIAEANVLGACIRDPSTIDAHDIRAEHFNEHRFRVLYAHLGLLRENLTPIDCEHLVESLKQTGDYERIGGAGCVLEAYQAYVVPSRFPEYLARLHDLTARRGLLSLGIDAIQAAHSKKSTAEIIDDTRQLIADVQSQASGDDASVPVSAVQLMAEHRTLNEPVIDGIIRREETANIIAASKMGKSWFAYGMAFAVATERPWFRFPCRRGRVLIIDNELHKNVLAGRLRTVADALGLQSEDFAGWLHTVSLRKRLRNLYGIAADLEKIKPGTFDLVILDAFYRTMPAGVSENDNAAMAGLYNLIDATAGRLGCAWINVHHSSKGSQAEKAVTDVGAGAGAQSRAADAHLVLRPHETDGAVVLDAVVRSFAPVEPLALRWQFPLWIPDGSLDPAELRGRLNHSEQTRLDRDKESTDKVLAALLKGPQSARLLRGVVGGGKDRTERLLDTLEAAGHIEWETVAGKGGKHRAYRLKETGL